MNKWFVIENSEYYYMYGPFDTEEEAWKWASATPNALFAHKDAFDHSMKDGTVIVLKARNPHDT